jgi:hypothetical protein
MRHVLAVIVLLAACKSNDADAKDPKRAKQQHDVAQLTVEKYAFEAFPSWAMSHPDKQCPAKLAELDEYMNTRDVKDPWGRPYAMKCGADLPKGAKAIAVYSFGEDGKDGTCDDVQSWDKDHACK